MGGKRTDLISERDVEVLGFIARFGVVPRSAVARWAATARSTTYARERRLHKDGLITVQQFFVRGEPLLIATKSGLHASVMANSVRPGSPWPRSTPNPQSHTSPPRSSEAATGSSPSVRFSPASAPRERGCSLPVFPAVASTAPICFASIATKSSVRRSRSC